jgi:N-glycosylase/DNA lyase
MEFKNDEKNFYILNADNFSLAETLDCGQAFRWSESCGVWQAMVGNRLWRLTQEGNRITVFDCNEEEFKNFVVPYFDLDRDYGAIASAVSENEVFCEAVKIAGGIRILRQDPWETLCSFIISQNNNIPRIKGIIDRLCENFGEKTDGGYTFPSAERIATLTLEDLAPLRSGFRAKYILDAAKKFASGEVSADKISALPTDEARAELMKIYGVGEKVADCALLFGFGRIDAFPKDVWIKRAMTVLFDGVLPECAVPFAGIAQQYLFHYARMTKLDF